MTEKKPVKKCDHKHRLADPHEGTDCKAKCPACDKKYEKPDRR